VGFAKDDDVIEALPADRKRVRDLNGNPLAYTSKRDAKQRAELYAEQAQGLRRKQPVRPAPVEPKGDAEPWWSAFFAERERRGDSDWKGDDGRYRAHIKPVIDTPVSSVTRDDSERLRDALDEKIRSGELAWKTAWNVWSVWTTACAAASGSKVRALRVRTDNPCAGVEPSDRQTAKSKAWLWPSEFLALVSCPDVALDWRRIYALTTPWCPNIHRRPSSGLAEVEVEQSAEARATADDGRGGIVVRGCSRRSDQPAAEPLMVAFGVVVFDELAEQVPQVSLAEDDEVVEALGADGPHEPLRIRIAVGAACRDARALHALGSEQVPPSLGEQRIAIVMPAFVSAARSSSAKWSSTKTHTGSATSGGPKGFTSGSPKNSTECWKRHSAGLEA
jgi:hypothetical protein